MEQTQVDASKTGLTQYTIIEDCSPYYIRFTFSKLELVINQFRKQLADVPPDYDITGYPEELKHRSPKFKPLPLHESLIKYAKSVVPFWNTFDFNVPRFTVSEAGLKFPIHRDSDFEYAGINFMIDVLDEECITNWYSNESLAHLSPRQISVGLKPWMFDINDDDPRPAPIKTTVFKPNECVLVNTHIWHDWDNSKSTNRRVNLLCRGLKGSPTFEEMRKTLFGY